MAFTKPTARQGFNQLPISQQIRQVAAYEAQKRRQWEAYIEQLEHSMKQLEKRMNGLSSVIRKIAPKKR